MNWLLLYNNKVKISCETLSYKRFLSTNVIAIVIQRVFFHFNDFKLITHFTYVILGYSFQFNRDNEKFF